MAIAADCVRLPSDWSPSAQDLRDRVILVTGAAGGLGRAVSLAAARAGAGVVLLGRKVRPLEKLYDDIVALDAAVQPAIYPLDLAGATPRDYQQMAERIQEQCGRLDGIVHAAAHFNELQPAADIPAEEWLRCLHVNVSAPFFLTQACLPLLQKADDAAVVFVLDDTQRMGRAHWGGYGVAKHGLSGLASILHQEWENTKVRVHTLIPAPMRTTLRRAAYFGEDSMTLPLPDETAPAVVHLLSAAAAPMSGRTLDLRAA